MLKMIGFGNRSEIKRINIELPVFNLTQNITVDFISDLHLRRRRCIEEIINALSQNKSDILLMGGDYAEMRLMLEPFFMEVTRLYKRVIGIAGNNDLLQLERIYEYSKKIGFEFLRDESTEINELKILGTKDPYKEIPNVILPLHPFVILSHSPDILLYLDEKQSASILTGHTHAGQIRFGNMPWWSHTRVGRKYGDRRSTRGKNEVFTSRGVGCSLLEIRNVPREIYTVTFVPKEK